jgi:hypothetical protein
MKSTQAGSRRTKFDLIDQSLVKEQRQCLILDPVGSTPLDWLPGNRPVDSKISMAAFTELGDMPNFIICIFVALGHLLKDHTLPKSNRAKLAKRLNKLAEDVDKELETPTTAANTLAQKYARAIEKGVNDKARRTDRHEALLELMSPFLREK